MAAPRDTICIGPSYRSFGRLQPYSANVSLLTPIKGRVFPALCSLFGRTSYWSHLYLRHLFQTPVGLLVYPTPTHLVSIQVLIDWVATGHPWQPLTNPKFSCQTGEPSWWWASCLSFTGTEVPTGAQAIRVQNKARITLSTTLSGARPQIRA